MEGMYNKICRSLLFHVTYDKSFIKVQYTKCEMKMHFSCFCTACVFAVSSIKQTFPTYISVQLAFSKLRQNEFISTLFEIILDHEKQP